MSVPRSVGVGLYGLLARDPPQHGLAQHLLTRGSIAAATFRALSGWARADGEDAQDSRKVHHDVEHAVPTLCMGLHVCSHSA